MKLERILVPIDFSDMSRLALEEADRLAVEKNAQLTLLHVHQVVQLAILEFTFVEPAPKIAAIVEAAEKQLESWAAGLKTPPERRQIRVDTGQPLMVIIEHSEHHDLIVMPTHGRTGPTHFFLGSVAERVVQGAKCSVLVVKKKPDQAITAS
jgi:nucleotide-binding universal stress UspA family protein